MVTTLHLLHVDWYEMNWLLENYKESLFIHLFIFIAILKTQKVTYTKHTHSHTHIHNAILFIYLYCTSNAFNRSIAFWYYHLTAANMNVLECIRKSAKGNLKTKKKQICVHSEHSTKSVYKVYTYSLHRGKIWLEGDKNNNYNRIALIYKIIHCWSQ